MLLEFFTNPMSRGQIARWALEETGAPYEERLVAYGPDMKSPDYLAVNPMGKVPAIRHGGRVVTEGAAICAYLADAFPEAGLAPPAEKRHDYYRWLFFAAGPVEQAVTSRSMSWTPTEEQTRMVGFGSYDLTFDVLDQFLQDRDYVCGETFTIADVYLGAQVIWGLEFATISERPSFTAYRDRLTARDPYRKAKARDEKLIEEAQKAGG